MSRSPLASAGSNNNMVNHSSAALKTIQEIQFGIFSPEDVKKMSVVEVLYPEMMVYLLPASFLMTVLMNLGWNPNTASWTRTGRPKDGLNRSCFPLCFLRWRHAELSRPFRSHWAGCPCLPSWYAFYLIALMILLTLLSGFMRKIQKLLETVCHNCGKILVDEVRSSHTISFCFFC